MVDEKRRNEFYQALVEDGYTFGGKTDRAAFDAMMADTTRAKKTYAKLIKSGYELDDYDTWYSNYGPQPSGGAPNTKSISEPTDEEKVAQFEQQVGAWNAAAAATPGYSTAGEKAGFEKRNAPLKRVYAPAASLDEGTSRDDIRREKILASGGDPLKSSKPEPAAETKQPSLADTAKVEQPAVEEPQAAPAPEYGQQDLWSAEAGGNDPLGLMSRANQMKRGVEQEVLGNEQIRYDVRQYAGSEEVKDRMDEAINGAVAEANKIVEKRNRSLSESIYAPGGSAGMAMYNATKNMADMAPSKSA